MGKAKLKVLEKRRIKGMTLEERKRLAKFLGLSEASRKDLDKMLREMKKRGAFDRKKKSKKKKKPKKT